MSIIEREVQAVPEVLTEREQRARTLEGAALEIEVRGWTQRSKGCLPNRPNLCVLGGILAALDNYDWGEGDWYPDAAKQWGDISPIAIYEWNDAVGRTADEVTFLLRWRAEEIRDGR